MANLTTGSGAGIWVNARARLRACQILAPRLAKQSGCLRCSGASTASAHAAAPAPRRQHPRRSQEPRARSVLVRTSEHWWEDEEEFDAITEIVIPKQLHLAVVAAGAGTSQVDWVVVGEAAEAAVKSNAGGKFASGFTGQPSKAADASAEQVSSAAEALWTELCGQTWRPELDYGVAGGDANPTDQLLLACNSLAAERLLAHAGLAADAAARAAGYVRVAVPGYNAAEAAAPLESWRQLGPHLADGASAKAGMASAAR